MSALLDRLFWTVDEDGETVHRLGAEWDGNHGPRWQWGDYRSEADLWELNVGTSWSRWGLGIEADWHHWSAWIADPPFSKTGERVPYREQSVTLTLGPLYVSWRRAHPARVPELRATP